MIELLIMLQILIFAFDVCMVIQFGGAFVIACTVFVFCVLAFSVVQFISR